MTTISEVETKIDAHVDVCAVRYEGIERELKNLDCRLEREMRGVNARLKRIEAIMIACAGAALLMLAHIAFK